MKASPLLELARFYGIETAYYDIEGHLCPASEEALLAVLPLLGAPVASPEDVPGALREGRQASWRRIMEPVTVAWEGEPASVEVQLPASLEGNLDGELALENGEGRHLRWQMADLPVLESTEIEGARYHRRRLNLEPLPTGYHRLTLGLPGRPASLVIAAPPQAYCPPDQKKDWGVFLPLYALHSEKNGGSGDYSGLDALAEWVSGLGGSHVATLPLLPSFMGFPLEPSPYLPVSRLLWNEFYVNLTDVPEITDCPSAGEMRGSPAFRLPLEAGRRSELVDYHQEMALKRRSLEGLARRFFSSGQTDALKQFLIENPVVADYARFRAATESQAATWGSWPLRMREGDLREKDYDAHIEQYYLYTQWLAHRQVEQASRRAREKGVSLYLDLPLGVHPDGYDAWREQALFVPASVGAPPDAVFTRGQSWGFPPLHPERIREQGYRYITGYIRHHCRCGGVLRIDHMMGAHRLFWIPRSMENSQGVYVRYHPEELYAILCLESQRHRVIVVGEDLGIVPPEVRPAMSRHGVHRMYVVQYELTTSPEAPFQPVPTDSIASVNTHDMFPFTAFWQGQDIQSRQELGILKKAKAKAEIESRGAVKEALLAFLRNKGWLKEESPDEASLLRACLDYLATSPARLVTVNLEDLWGETRPQNIPSTREEYPNWQRRAHYSLEEFRQMPAVRETLKTLDRLRKEGAPMEPAVPSPTLLSEEDLYLFNEGSHFCLHHKLGAHPMERDGRKGTFFAVWAPDAAQVFLTGDFNQWDKSTHPMKPRGSSGVWELFVPGIGQGTLYKYHIVSRYHGYRVDKADPLAFYSETPPRTASVVWGLDYRWGDQQWLEKRRQSNSLNAPISIYEVHPGSWRRVPEEGSRFLTYRELAPQLADYVRQLGFTHVEFLPVMEHPFYGSWGYQITGYFAPTSRYGTPQDLMYLVDYLHQQGIGVILDWVPSHFPTDEHGLGFFDGTHLYEHALPAKGFHPDWTSFIFNYGRNEVRSFLISNALFWLEQYHLDGLRLDAVASMLYLDYSRKNGDWIPNEYGGNENLEAIAFLRKMNQEVYRRHPDVHTIAEESTAWPMVSRPTYVGGLGFGLKWDMGWMHDTLSYFSHDPVHRKFHHNDLTFRSIYAFAENFILPLSHDEVVHGKGSLLGRMPGDNGQKMANLRLLLGYMYAQSGKKLLFMGGEFGQWREWYHEESLDWHLLDYAPHAGLQRWVADLNQLYRREPALYELDCDPAGFEWVDCNDTEQSILTFLRKGKSTGNIILAVANFTPVSRLGYRVGVPRGGFWREVLNSDAREYGGSGLGNKGGVEAFGAPYHHRPGHLSLTVPPLSMLFFKSESR